jgi:hypothetical protein
MAERLVEDIFTALDKQTVTVPGTEAAALIVPSLAGSLTAVLDQRIYYDKKIAQGKHHTQALLCLARRRADVLFAMLRDGTFDEPQPVRALAPQT